jgi:hypothetical protein
MWTLLYIIIWLDDWVIRFMLDGDVIILDDTFNIQEKINRPSLGEFFVSVMATSCARALPEPSALLYLKVLSDEN